MRKGMLLALLIGLASVGTAQAIDKTVGIDAGSILTQQRQIHDEAMARKGRYKDMNDAKRNELLANQNTVFDLLNGKTHSNDLADADRVRLFNALEAIEATVNNARDEQMVCEFVKRIGTNRRERMCKTVGQREREREAAERELGVKSGCTSAGCTSN